MQGDGNPNLGPWDGDDFQNTLSKSGGIGVDSGLPEVVRFRSNMTKLVATLFPEDGVQQPDKLPAIFIFSPTPPEDAAEHNPKREPMLNNGIIPILGRVWFVGPTANTGKFVEYGGMTDDELFTFVEQKLGAGKFPAVLYDPRTNNGHVRFYSKGLACAEVCDVVDLACPEISVERIKHELERVYEACLKTPAVQGKEEKLWRDKAKHWPIQNAEDRIQTYLRVHLNGAFPTCDIYHERPTGPEGRFDIQVVETSVADKSVKMQHCILELKVLRSFGSNGSKYSDQSNLEWIKSGVNQAAAYRDSRHANSKWCALVCFDMRITDEGTTACFAHVKSVAVDLRVSLMRWFLYSDTKTLQQAHAIQSSGTG